MSTNVRYIFQIIAGMINFFFHKIYLLLLLLRNGWEFLADLKRNSAKKSVKSAFNSAKICEKRDTVIKIEPLTVKICEKCADGKRFIVSL